MKERIEYLIKRIRLRGQDKITYDEIATWPLEQVKELEKHGYIRQIEDADGIICGQCDEPCYKTVEVRKNPQSAKLIGTFFCEDEEYGGPITVDLKRLQQWEINKKKLLPDIEKNDSPKESLNTRVANEIIKHVNAKSPDVARLVDSTAGSVRTTVAWKMRKQLRERYDSKKGWKDSKGNMDAFDSQSVTEEHWDVLSIFQDYSQGKTKDFPTPDFIATKLNIPTNEASKLIKEAESIFGSLVDTKS